ncbi:MAG: phosphoribosylaminoimidazolesuccinocarboxamide synthase [Corallococcus sp.]|nr:phosphoribosylaminoimidazolesuccinocarboxamide synthase [Corallococcus sp.]
MEYEKHELIAEGKTKRLWATQNEGYLIAEFKDDAQAYHGKKKIYFDGKAKLSNGINAILMSLLEENGIPTHFISVYSPTEYVVRKAEMIPVEMVVRNYAAGSMCKRLGLAERMKLKAPVLEFCYKNDALDDPVINEYHAYAMGLCTQEELGTMYYAVTRINKVLTDVMNKIGVAIADFKVEFGRVNGRLMVADEITPTTSRMWDSKTLKKFGCETADLSMEYKEILERLTKLK